MDEEEKVLETTSTSARLNFITCFNALCIGPGIKDELGIILVRKPNIAIVFDRLRWDTTTRHLLWLSSNQPYFQIQFRFAMEGISRKKSCQGIKEKGRREERAP